MAKQIKTVLVVNAGSSSLKYMLFDMTCEKMLAKGQVERIGLDHSVLSYQKTGCDKIQKEVEASNHTLAMQEVCAILTDDKIGTLKSLSEVDAIGHRVVHGGECFSASVEITPAVIETVEKCSAMAPLHNPANLEGIRACEKAMPGVPSVGVFDTAFHQTMPKETYMYALPEELHKKYGVRKYGFHGTSHKFVTHRAAEVLGKPLDELNIITCHLGNGSSISAIKNGKVYDTSMGFTPLAGVIMGTRSGDVDPGVIFYLAKQGISVEELDTICNKKSGLSAISGTGSSDMRDLCTAVEQGSEQAKIALNAFTHRILMYIGGYIAALGRVDAIIMTGGIGENSHEARQSILPRLAGLGVKLDSALNDKMRFGAEGLITTADSSIPVYVLPTNEELMIARDTYSILSK